MKVSIITATYNSQDKLARCLDSVAKQTCLDNIEHIIVDGGSTDETMSVVSTYPHINRVISEKDDGIYDAFNKGLNFASGDVIYYLNSDDELYNNRVIKDVIAIFGKHSIDFLSAKVMICDETSQSEWLQHPRKILIKNNTFDYPSHQSFFIRTALLRSYGGFPRCFSLVADSYVMLKAFSSAKGHFLDIPVARFFTGGASSSTDNIHKLDTELAAVFQLVGVSKPTELESTLSLTKANFERLRTLFIHYLSGLKPFKPNIACRFGRIGIFGSGVMSTVIFKILQSRGFSVDSFITTEGSEAPVHGIVVNSVRHVVELDIIINCVEGAHAADIDQLCLALNSNLIIWHWYDIYD